jgi:hypothetical protein
VFLSLCRDTAFPEARGSAWLAASPAPIRAASVSHQIYFLSLSSLPAEFLLPTMRTNAFPTSIRPRRMLNLCVRVVPLLQTRRARWARQATATRATAARSSVARPAPSPAIRCEQLTFLVPTKESRASEPPYRLLFDMRPVPPTCDDSPRFLVV